MNKGCKHLDAEVLGEQTPQDLLISVQILVEKQQAGLKLVSDRMKLCPFMPVFFPEINLHLYPHRKVFFILVIC